MVGLADPQLALNGGANAAAGLFDMQRGITGFLVEDDDPGRVGTERRGAAQLERILVEASAGEEQNDLSDVQREAAGVFMLEAMDERAFVAIVGGQVLFKRFAGRDVAEFDERLGGIAQCAEAVPGLERSFAVLRAGGRRGKVDVKAAMAADDELLLQRFAGGEVWGRLPELRRLFGYDGEGVGQVGRSLR